MVFYVLPFANLCYFIFYVYLEVACKQWLWMFILSMLWIIFKIQIELSSDFLWSMIPGRWI